MSTVSGSQSTSHRAPLVLGLSLLALGGLFWFPGWPTLAAGAFMLMGLAAWLKVDSERQTRRWNERLEAARREAQQAGELAGRRSGELRSLQAFLEVLAHELDLSRLAERTLEDAARALNLELATLYSLGEAGRYQLLASYGFSRDEQGRLASADLSVTSTGLSELVRTGTSLRLEAEPIGDHPVLRGRFPDHRVKGYYAVALTSAGTHQGLLELVPKHSEPLPPEALDQLHSLAHVVGTAIQRSGLVGQLRREKQASDAVLEHMADGVFTLAPGRASGADRDHLRLSAFNQAAERITGWPRGQLLGLRYSEVFSDPEGEAYLREVLLGTQPATTYERDVPVRDGVKKVIAFSPTCFEGQTGPALIVVFRDISRIRELELLRGDFTATISHELRTPITSIKNYLLQMMHKKYPFEPEATRTNLGIINHQADRLNRLIQDLMEAARLDSQALEVRLMNIEVGALITRVVEGYRSKDTVHPIRWEAPPALRASCDPDQLRYVLDHLLSNAIKYSVSGGVIEVQAQARGDFLAISVRDEGVGIPFDHQERIFEKYHRVETGNTRTHYGVGLGLYIARKVIEAHGGQITVESTPGCGSTFTVTVPVAPPEKEEGRSVPALDKQDLVVGG